MTSSAAEDVQIAGMRVALQYFLDLQRQAVHPTPHVGVADCQPNPHPRRNRDHRPDSALTTVRRQPGRDRRRDPHAGLPRKFDLDHRCRRTPGVIPGRRDQNLGKTSADSKLSAPAINLAGPNLRAASDLCDHRPRRQALGNNRPLLLGAPTPPPFWPRYNLNPRHRTVSNTSANTIICTSAYQPIPPQLRKAAITGGKPRGTGPRRTSG